MLLYNRINKFMCLETKEGEKESQSTHNPCQACSGICRKKIRGALESKPPVNIPPEKKANTSNTSQLASHE